MKNVFNNYEVAKSYDDFYDTEFGKKVDEIEKNIVNELLNEIPRGEMLELGCGTGHWTQFFLSLGFKITAADISTSMLTIAQNKLPEILFLHADAAYLPFKDNTFDFVAAITMLEFVTDQDEAIYEMFRVLKQKGLMLLGFLNSESTLGKNKENDDTFRNAEILTIDKIKAKLQKYGEPKIITDVYINSNFELVKKQANVEPAFIAVLIQKK